MVRKLHTFAFGMAVCSLTFAWQNCDAQTYTYGNPLPQATYASSVAPMVSTAPTVYYPATPAIANPAANTFRTSSSTTVQTPKQVSPGLAQRKASQAADGQVQGHIGGGLGGATYEGVGWSNQSPQAAIQNCCYWGTRPVSQIGVSKAANGCWYACVLYH